MRGDVYMEADDMQYGDNKYGNSKYRDNKYGVDIDELKKRNVLGENMSLIRKRKGLSQRDLSRELRCMGVDLTAGALSRWERGDAQPNAYQLLAWCRIFDINEFSETLFDVGRICGRGDMILNTRGEELLFEIREALAASGRYKIHPVSDPGGSDTTLLRVYNQSAAAGTGNFLDDEDYEELEFPVSHVPQGTDFGIRIFGDSMEPKYMDGGIAMVHSCRKLDNGDTGIFIYNGNAFIKQYREISPSEDELCEYTDSAGVTHRKIILHSLNAAYRDITVAPGGDFGIIGRVLN